ncbi:MAG: spore maturation protein A, partial [Oscillospiraceae bacterium]|nr:spore maturation protein A [Oscillospiraceae bacterium]
MAMTIIWMGMVAAAMIYAALHGTGAALSGAVAAGAKQAVELSLTMAGSLCLWSGFAALLRAGGLQRRLAALLSPLLGRIYPTAARDPETMESLCGNATANLLGLGNAATPLGIAAVRRMQALSG